MKALVISDIHGSGYYADKIREIVERENPEKIILLGDLYYHGPRNDLSQEYNPMKVAETLNSMKDRILVVRGNCDAEVDEMISEFKFNDHILMEINGKKFYFTHGQQQQRNCKQPGTGSLHLQTAVMPVAFLYVTTFHTIGMFRAILFLRRTYLLQYIAHSIYILGGCYSDFNKATTGMGCLFR